MKKSFIFLLFGVVVTGCLFACKAPQSPAAAAVQQGQQGTESASHETSPRSLEDKATPVSARGYRTYAQSLSEGAYKQDAVAIERLAELNGACNSAISAKPALKMDADMARLQNFCRGYQSGVSGGVNWSKSYSAVLSARLDEIRAKQGAQAVSQELGRLLAEDMKPQEARDALEYAARNDVVPAQLFSMVDRQIAGTSVQREQLEVLAHVEFCRRGGDCGSNDFSTLVACVAIGPCQSGDGLLSVVRRKTSPENFDAAQKMSQALARG